MRELGRASARRDGLRLARRLGVVLALLALLAVSQQVDRCVSETARGGEDDAAGENVAWDRGPCRVRRVVDGDTVDVRCDGRTERVRMLRIDTPERDEPGYREASRALASLVREREVHLVFEQPGEPERDDHGRVLAYVYAEGTNANVEMVRQGWSRFWTRYGRGRYAAAFRRAEEEARTNRRGLWSDRNPRSSTRRFRSPSPRG